MKDGFTIARGVGRPSDPFALARELLGVEPLLVERQPIRPVEGGRSFASTRIDTPLHTDSQLVLGVPAAVQILVCVKPAPRGGESVLVDGARVIDRLWATPLGDALFDVERVQRFYFGDVRGPTVALRGGHLAWTLAPGAHDEVGAALHAELAREQPVVFALGEGDALVASNHRMLHGRRPFDGERELVRLLVWLEEPLPADARHVARAKVAAPAFPPELVRRLRVVLGILRGVPPAKAASDARVDEATLYAWRDALLRGGIDELLRSP